MTTREGMNFFDTDDTNNTNTFANSVSDFGMFHGQNIQGFLIILRSKMSSKLDLKSNIDGFIFCLSLKISFSQDYYVLVCMYN